MPFGASSGQYIVPDGFLTLAGAASVVYLYSTSADFQMHAKHVLIVCSFPLQACNVFRLYNGKAAEAELKALADRGRNLQVWCWTPRYRTSLNPGIHPPRSCLAAITIKQQQAGSSGGTSDINSIILRGWKRVCVVCC